MDECEWERRVSSEVLSAFCDSLKSARSHHRNPQIVAQQPVAAAPVSVARTQRLHDGLVAVDGTRCNPGGARCCD